MAQPTYLTTAELADLLRIKERKVYDLVATNAVPHTKATGKTLFPLAEVNAWLDSHAGGPAGATNSRQNVIVGSHDPLLERAVRQSGCGLAMLFDGSLDGLARYSEGQGIAAGTHIQNPTGGWNTEAIEAQKLTRCVLIEWAKRSRGLMVKPELSESVSALSDIKGLRAATRQPSAASYALFATLIEEQGLSDQIEITAEAGTEADAALALLEDRADVALGLGHVADSHGLHFVPLMNERYDLLVDRKGYFDEPFQTFWNWCETEKFRDMVNDAKGYDFSARGTVHFNAA